MRPTRIVIPQARIAMPRTRITMPQTPVAMSPQSPTVIPRPVRGTRSNATSVARSLRFGCSPTPADCRTRERRLPNSRPVLPAWFTATTTIRTAPLSAVTSRAFAGHAGWCWSSPATSGWQQRYTPECTFVAANGPGQSRPAGSLPAQRTVSRICAAPRTPAPCSHSCRRYSPPRATRTLRPSDRPAGPRSLDTLRSWSQRWAESMARQPGVCRGACAARSERSVRWPDPCEPVH